MSEPLSAAPSEIAPEPEQPIIQPYKPCCNPCPCTTLQCGVKSIATLEIILGIVTIGFFAYILKLLLPTGHCDARTLVTNVLMMVSFMAISFLHIYLATFLCMGANELSRSKCCVYFIGQILLIIAAIIIIIIQTLNAIATDDLPYKVTAGGYSIYVLISTYFALVVYFFMQELNFNSFQPPFPVPDQESQAGVVRPLSSGLVSVQGSGAL